jgi:hypothetical protein
MMRHLVRRPSPAMAVALIALFVALGGTSLAALRIGTRQIVDNSVRGKDIRNGTLGGRDVKNNRLTGADVKGIRGVDVNDNSLTGADVLESSLGLVPRAIRAAGVSGLSNSRQVRAIDDGPDVPILSAGGFQFLLHCNLGAALGSHIVIKNLSAGDDSQLDDNVNGDDDPDFNEGEEANVDYSETGSADIENSAFSAVGSKGSAIHGQAAILTSPSGFRGSPDCVGTLSVQGG